MVNYLINVTIMAIRMALRQLKLFYRYMPLLNKKKQTMVKIVPSFHFYKNYF